MGLRVESTGRSCLGILDPNAAELGFRGYLAPCRSFRHRVPTSRAEAFAPVTEVSASVAWPTLICESNPHCEREERRTSLE